MIVDILDSLAESIKDLENYYLTMTSQYPPLLSYLEDHIEKMDYPGPNSEEDSITDSLNTQNTELQVNHNNQLLIADKIKGVIKKGSEHDRDIVDIRDYAQDLELYSLNAMVSAIKSGKDAGAFPYITKEIQKVSIQSFQVSEKLLQKGSDLVSLLQKVKDSISDETGEQSKYVAQIKDLVDKINHDITQNKIDFNQYTLKTKQTYSCMKEAISHIISEVQKQDIFRQSIDHILLSFQQVEYFTLDTLENSLDYHKYNSDLFNFSAKIVDEISSNLKQSIDVFENCHNEIASQISSDTIFETLRKELSDNSSELSELLCTIDSSVTKEKTAFERGSIFKNTDGCTKEIEDLIYELKGNIDRIDLINMSNRIEITRNNEIPGIGEAVKNIGLSSGKILEKVTILQDYINGMSKQMRISINHYSESAANCQDFITDYNTTIKKNVEFLMELSKDLTDQISKMVIFSEELKTLDQNLIRDIQKTKKIQENLNDAYRYFNEQNLFFNNSFTELLNGCHYEEWNIESGRIKEILDKFTIFTHKEAFSGKNELESQGAKNGEITLF